MQFIYLKNAKDDYITIEKELHKYLFKVRRAKANSEFFFRNLEDKKLYRYLVETINRSSATLKLIDSTELVIESKNSLDIVWCKIDPKSIDRVLPMLNELGVNSITFVNCEYSQKSYKIDIERFNRILINSSQQCGRSSILKIYIEESLQDYLIDNSNLIAFDFSTKTLTNEIVAKHSKILVGCEGGFSDSERELMQKLSIDSYGLDSKIILKSETAVTLIASKLI